MSTPSVVRAIAIFSHRAGMTIRQSRPSTICRSVAAPRISIQTYRFLSSTDAPAHTPNAPAAGTTDVNSDVSSVSSIPISPLPPSHLSEAELRVYNILAEELEPTELEVMDISGGCGSMYGIEVVSDKFRGKRMLQQQRMVNDALKDIMEKENWHGVQIRTRAE